jgi:rod shape-determining protein MreC
MAVITAEGVVGKVLRVYNSTSLVLLINDQTSGVGAILENSRLQGILRGTPAGKVVLEKILSDEQVQPGEPVQTSGGDQIFPKGLPAGVVSSVSRGPDTFLEIHVHPAADLSKLEEVLVITEQEKRVPVAEASTPMRAVDVLAQRLPSVPDKPPSSPATEAGPATNQATPAAKPAANAPTRANKSSGAAREAGMKAAATPPKPAPKPNSAAAAKTPPKPAASTDQAAQPNPESGNPPQ